MTPAVQNEMYDDRALHDAATRWQVMDGLVDALRAFKPGRTLKDEEKRALLTFIERIDYLMPPSLKAQRKYAYEETVGSLTNHDVMPYTVVTQCERWCTAIRRMSDRIAPLPPHYDGKLFNGRANEALIRQMQAASMSIAHMVLQCEAQLPVIEQRFPKFYEALMPYRYAVRALEVKGAAVRFKQNKLDGDGYVAIVEGFLADPRHQSLCDDETRTRISNSKNSDADKAILTGIIPREVMKIQLPSTGNQYRGFHKVLTEALAADIKTQFPMDKKRALALGRSEGDGDSAKMLLSSNNEKWIESVYELRWMRVAREVAKQLEMHKNEFRGYRLAPVVEQEKNGQSRLYGF